jgi:hypothetical protein
MMMIQKTFGGDLKIAKNESRAVPQNRFGSLGLYFDDEFI